MFRVESCDVMHWVGYLISEAYLLGWSNCYDAPEKETRGICVYNQDRDLYDQQGHTYPCCLAILFAPVNI